MTLQVIPIKLMVQCPMCSEIFILDLVESKDCHKCRYKVWLFANEVHCNYPDEVKKHEQGGSSGS